MALEFLGKDAERRPEQSRRAIGVTAGTASRQQASPALDVLEVTRRRCQAGNAPRGRGDGAQAEGARPALAGALVREIRQDSRGLDDTASF
jgi:hypothetical protein